MVLDCISKVAGSHLAAGLGVIKRPEVEDLSLLVKQQHSWHHFDFKSLGLHCLPIYDEGHLEFSFLEVAGDLSGSFKSIREVGPEADLALFKF